MKKKHERILLRPTLYRQIKLPSKSFYDTWIPLAVGGISTVIVWYGNRKIPLWDEHGIISSIQLILTILPGFFITALAAIATFDKPTLDETMHGTPPTLTCCDLDNEPKNRPLSRRRFLSLLFGYLSMSTLLLYIFGAVLNTTNHTLLVMINEDWKYYHTFFLIFESSFTFIYLTCFTNIVTTTLLGLFYLSDRLHWYEPKLID